MRLQAHNEFCCKKQNAPTGKSRGDLKTGVGNVSFCAPLPSTRGHHNPPLVGRGHHDRPAAVRL
jgi:hypothetical protein